MSQRFTRKNCEDMVEILANAMNRPTVPYIKNEEGKLVPNTGAWFLDEYQGGYKIVEMLPTTAEAEPFGATRYPPAVFCSMIHRLLDMKRILDEEYKNKGYLPP